jgi:hypothetical protein
VLVGGGETGGALDVVPLDGGVLGDGVPAAVVPPAVAGLAVTTARAGEPGRDIDVVARATAFATAEPSEVACLDVPGVGVGDGAPDDAGAGDTDGIGDVGGWGGSGGKGGCGSCSTSTEGSSKTRAGAARCVLASPGPNPPEPTITKLPATHAAIVRTSRLQPTAATAGERGRR